MQLHPHHFCFYHFFHIHNLDGISISLLWTELSSHVSNKVMTWYGLSLIINLNSSKDEGTILCVSINQSINQLINFISIINLQYIHTQNRQIMEGQSKCQQGLPKGIIQQTHKECMNLESFKHRTSDFRWFRRRRKGIKGAPKRQTVKNLNTTYTYGP